MKRIACLILLLTGVISCTRLPDASPEPRSAKMYYDRAFARHKKGDLDGAIADYTKAIELDPKFALAYYSRSVARGRKGDRDGVIADSTKAIELDSKNAEAYEIRGLAELAQGKDAEAQKDFDQYLKLRPDSKPELEKLIKTVKEKRAKKP